MKALSMKMLEVSVCDFSLHFFAFFGQNTSVTRVYGKPVTRDKLQKYIRIPNGAESGFLP